MNEAHQADLTALANEVDVAALPSECKHTVVWCMRQLPALYNKFRHTQESRYADEITRLVQGVLKELVKSGTACPEALQLAVSITDRLRLLHEQLGLSGPELKMPSEPKSRSRTPVLKTPGAAKTRSRKVG